MIKRMHKMNLTASVIIVNVHGFTYQKKDREMYLFKQQCLFFFFLIFKTKEIKKVKRWEKMPIHTGQDKSV